MTVSLRQRNLVPAGIIALTGIAMSGHEQVRQWLREWRV
jgi:hypothetical protein